MQLMLHGIDIALVLCFNGETMSAAEEEKIILDVCIVVHIK
jgi:hypothetical protein